MGFFSHGNDKGNDIEQDFMGDGGAGGWRQSYNLILAIIVVIISAICTFWILNCGTHHGPILASHCPF